VPRRRAVPWVAFLVLWPIAAVAIGGATVGRHTAAADETFRQLAQLGSCGSGWSLEAFARRKRLWVMQEPWRGLVHETAPYPPTELLAIAQPRSSSSSPGLLRIGRRALGRRLTYATLSLDESGHKLCLGYGGEQYEGDWIGFYCTVFAAVVGIEGVGAFAFLCVLAYARQREANGGRTPPRTGRREPPASS